jgi:anaerobic selenocysteine-containing dehydrogenase
MSNGLEATQAVLALDALAGNLGKAGGLFLSPGSLVHSDFPWLPNSLADMEALIDRMRRGEVKALFIHGANPMFELPTSMGFSYANVPQVISFASFLDDTSSYADYILPDHTPLESWGYQKAPTGADRSVISGFQPAVAPFYKTKSTSDVLLAAVQSIGGDLAAALPYMDEVEYMQSSLLNLVTQEGFFNAPEIKTFMAQFQQYGGWWDAGPKLGIPNGTQALSLPLSAEPGKFAGDGDFYLLTFMSPILGDGSGANKPWLQETPDPTTTVMWNSWVEINPASADKLGLEDDDVVVIRSPTDERLAVVYRYPAIRLDTIAIPFGQGHSTYGRYATERGVNPHYSLIGMVNGADDLAIGATKVYIEKTGRKQPLSRLESRLGVYGSE